ncbi:glycosyltransferase [Bacillus sp. HMF5848]|uniref:glycosyltransferase n=1 Tax=Bacillus sp. HMF5848 TaxID=2495421 RepID=UPI000F79C21D|nr:glycosyltransferase [Bacillus sp. HMF5848]RSK27533.1 glycosyltransferase [Bacillus sp. HMF5848]
MKVTFLTLGSQGDVQPYVALGNELVKRGHDVVICTGATFKSFIENYGITFYPASADLMAIVDSEEGRRVFNGGQYNIFKMMKYAKEVITPAYRKSMDDFLAAASGSDLIVYHPKALGAVDIAEYLKIPCICLPPVPIVYPITEFPNFAISATKNLGPFLNRLTYKAIHFSESPYIKHINEFRAKSLGLPKRKTGERLFEVSEQKIPIVYPISPALFKEVKSWKDHVSLTGFFYLEMENASLEEELDEFISRGDKPIVVSFSSMPLKNPEAFKEKLLTALRETNNRAVILTGTSGMSFQHDETIFSVSKAPHRLIFQRAKGIIHHGGVGTMAEALLSGVPQLIMPFTVDQPFWAYQLHSKGYAIKPLREKNLKTSELVAALQLMENAQYIKSAMNIQKEIEAERGLDKAISYIEDLVKR